MADIADSLGSILDFKTESQGIADQLAQTGKTLQNIQDENDRLNDEVIELTSRYNSSEQKIEKLQIELRKLMDELEIKKTSQTEEKGLLE